MNIGSAFALCLSVPRPLNERRAYRLLGVLHNTHTSNDKASQSLHTNRWNFGSGRWRLVPFSVCHWVRPLNQISVSMFYTLAVRHEIVLPESVLRASSKKAEPSGFFVSRFHQTKETVLLDGRLPQLFTASRWRQQKGEHSILLTGLKRRMHNENNFTQTVQLITSIRDTLLRAFQY